jgi:Fe-S oxidoreductase
MNGIPNQAINWIGPEMQPWVLGGITLLSIAFFINKIWSKVTVLRLAQPENRFENPGKRFLHMLWVAFAQAKLFKRAQTGWMHAFIFWGFCVLLLRAAQFFIIGFFPNTQFMQLGFLWSAYLLLKDFFITLIFLAVGFAFFRRTVLKPNRLTLSIEGLIILGLITLILISDIVFDAAFLNENPKAFSWGIPLGASLYTIFSGFLEDTTWTILHNLSYWIHISSILIFINVLPNSKHLHVIASFPNVFFANISKKGKPIHRIDFEDDSKEEFGVVRIQDFSWKRLLDFYTCTECGRCDLVCPALNSSKPLSPKEFTVDLRNHLNEMSPALLKMNSETIPPLAGNAILDETIWSCTTCGACEEECPVEIEYVNKMIDIRRGLVLSENRFPQEFNNAFKSLEVNSNPWGFGQDSRADWAKGLNVKVWDKKNPSEYLYFVGCNGSFDSRGKKISTSVVKLLKKAGVDFSILGNSEKCTGDPARRAGNEYLFEMLATDNAELLKESKVTKIVTHCPHCFNSLKNEYTDFDAHFEVVHHSELLENLIKQDKIKTYSNSKETIVFHDSCYLGRHNDIYDPPRKISSDLKEVENSKERGTCCGAGGARFLLEEKTGTRMNHNRIEELMETNPDTIAVSCPFCVLMLEDGLKAKKLDTYVKVKDISEILA